MAFFATTTRLLLLPLRKQQHPLLTRIPPTAAACSFSTSHGGRAASGEQCTAKYRRLLGIGDSPVVFRAKDQAWEPPQLGSVKLNFTSYIMETELPDGSHFVDKITGEKIESVYIFDALARNSSGNVVGFCGGFMNNFGNPSSMVMILYALRACGNLAQALRDEGIHDGPFVVEAEGEEKIARCLALGELCCSGEDEACLRDSIPDDLERVYENSMIDIGDTEEVMKVLDDYATKVDEQVLTVYGVTTDFVYRIICPQIKKRLTESAADAADN